MRVRPGPLVRLATRLAISNHRQQRWRLLFSSVVAFVGVGMMLAGACTYHYFSLVWDKSEARSFVPAAQSGGREASDMVLAEITSDEWDGMRVDIAWLQPAPGVSSVPLPPGLSRLPGPGEAAVSPALARLREQRPEVAARFPEVSEVIDQEGLVYASELTAYVAPPAGVRLDPESARKVIGYGSDNSDPLSSTVPPSQLDISSALILIIGLPTVLALYMAGSSTSPTRERRLGVLRLIGASRGDRAVVAAAENVLLSAPAVVLVTLLCRPIAGRLEWIPLVGERVFPGDLAPGWPVIAVLSVAWLLALAVVSALSEVIAGRRRDLRRRPGLMARGRLRLIPAGLGAAMVAAAPLVNRDWAFGLVVGGLVIMVFSLPLVLPRLLASIGATLRKRYRPSLLLAGRRLEGDPAGATRPLVGLGAVAAIVVSGTSIVAFLNGDDEPTPAAAGSSQISALEVWSVGEATGHGIDMALGGDFLLVKVAGGNEYSPWGSSVRIGASCPELASVIANIECSGEDDLALADESADKVGAVFDVPGKLVELVDEQTLNSPNRDVSTYAIGPDSEIMTSIFALASSEEFAPSGVAEASGRLDASPLDTRVDWFVAGLTAIAGAAVIVAFAGAVDRVVTRRREAALLTALGVSDRQRAVMRATEFLAASMATLWLGAIFGVGVALALARSGPIPWAVIGVLITTAGLACVTGAALVYRFGGTAGASVRDL